MEEVRNAILEEDLEDRGEPGLDAKTIMWLNSQNHRGHNQSAIGSNKHKRRSKFDKLLTSIHPLLAVGIITMNLLYIQGIRRQIVKSNLSLRERRVNISDV